MKLVILDSGCANLASVAFAFERLGQPAEISAEPDVIREATHVVLPGVGAAGTFMARLAERGLSGLIPALTKPCLGICLGMQVLFERSEEGDAETLGVFEGKVRRIPEAPGRTIPHMGWNRLAWSRPHPLLEGITPGAHLYFVHSYYAGPGTSTLATTEHGLTLSAMVAREPFYGVQFHPERSGKVGSRILENFLRLS